MVLITWYLVDKVSCKNKLQGEVTYKVSVFYLKKWLFSLFQKGKNPYIVQHEVLTTFIQINKKNKEIYQIDPFYS